MNVIFRLRLFIWCLILTPFISSASEYTGIVKGRDTKGLSIELISSVSSIKAGEPFKIGYMIKHDPKFHTYWKNPGVVGIPTQAKWSLPEGFSVSEIQWPFPEISNMAGHACYGYERDVLLTLEVTPPKQITQKQITLSADTNWMCCADICFPGHKVFTLTLPVGDGSLDDSKQTVFTEAALTTPKPSPNFKTSIISKPNDTEIKIVIESNQDFTPIHVFNSDRQTTPDLPYQFEMNKKNQWSYSAKRSDYGPSETDSFPFVLQTEKGYYKIVAQ